MSPRTGTKLDLTIRQAAVIRSNDIRYSICIGMYHRRRLSVQETVGDKIISLSAPTITAQAVFNSSSSQFTITAHAGPKSFSICRNWPVLPPTVACLKPMKCAGPWSRAIGLASRSCVGRGPGSPPSEVAVPTLATKEMAG